jgi:16S rRNA G966 N2-methylase RsmD
MPAFELDKQGAQAPSRAEDRMSTALSCLNRPPLASATADAIKAALAARENQNRTGELAVVATRNAGKLLSELQKTPKQSAATVAADSEYRKVLKETGLSERTAQYWQKLADIPETVVHEYFTAMKQNGSEITAKGLLAASTRRALRPSLAERFGAPPFSVLDAKQGYWHKRQRAWQELGISGVAGRSEDHVPAFLGTLSRLAERSGIRTETSIFNCALTETVYRWFAPVGGGRILDPFAGGSPRGIVAAKLGYHYTGVELCPEQVEENRKQAERIGLTPQWICGDSTKLSGHLGSGEEFDLIFTCPPYYNLERYGRQPEDLSNCKTYDAFMLLYELVFNQAVARLKQDRFLVVVIGEIRDERGFYRNFVGDTISCLMRLGLHYYNEMIFATPLGSVPLRGGAQFSKYRKVHRTHQNILAFWKGDDPKRIPEALGILDSAESQPVAKAA